MTPEWRDYLGRVVRDAWIAWATRQPDPKPSWLVPYDDLSVADQEADRLIGDAVWAVAEIDAEARITALTVAARAVVDAVWSPSTNVYLAGSLICRICMSPDGRHSQSCPVSALAALLAEADA